MTEYPKEMRHPAYVPATLSGYHRSGREVVNDPPGRPQRYPPVFVHNRDQEEYYAAQGYTPLGVADAERYKRELIGDLRAVAPDPDYPAWLYRVGEDGGMRSILVKNEAEREALVGEWFAEQQAAMAAAARRPVADATANELPAAPGKIKVMSKPRHVTVV